ncbi:MAG: hypothetical protein JWN38_824 [Candidatus Saccharibacteria bacterium]|nr:hypothetical protein [Candidatus Saccharibacteria bacterium]
MDVRLEPGKYVIAVSGGVDSVVLLDLLAKLAGVVLVVAHFDHGIRLDSAADREFVAGLAASYGLAFFSAEGHLGSTASEATARAARYDFLRSVQREQQATAIITAHHQDDRLETAVINMIRGTGRRGLTALADTPAVRRPLLALPKTAIVEYAHQRGLKWREDSTNSDQKYLRNYIRHHLVPRFSAAGRQQFIDHIDRLQVVNIELDELLNEVIADHGAAVLERAWFCCFNHAQAKEVLAQWLRAQSLTDFDAKTLERGVVGAKTLPAGSLVMLKNNRALAIGRESLALTTIER